MHLVHVCNLISLKLYSDYVIIDFNDFSVLIIHLLEILKICCLSLLLIQLPKKIDRLIDYRCFSDLRFLNILPNLRTALSLGAAISI